MQPSRKLDFTVQFLTGKHYSEIDKFNKFDPKKVVEHYDDVSVNYEGIYQRVGYPDPKKCQEYVSDALARSGRGAEHVEIIDFACGTGLVGQYLAEAGFTKITGVDISPKMLEQARAKGCYQKLEEMRLNNEDPFKDFPMNLRNKFDFVTVAGLLNGNYMTDSVFEEMMLALKHNGFLIIAARFSYLGDYWYVEKLNEMVKAGRLKFIKSEEFFKYNQLG